MRTKDERKGRPGKWSQKGDGNMEFFMADNELAIKSLFPQELFDALRGDVRCFVEYLRRLFGTLVISPLFLIASLLVFIFVPRDILQGHLLSSTSHLSKRFAKRFIDIFGATTGLLLSSVFFLVIPLLIKLDSRGPVFYKQQRIGQNRRRRDRRENSFLMAHDSRSGDRRSHNLQGKPFYVYKFRTMRQDAEKKSGPIWATSNDPRVTKVGRILRKTRIDEIPQFINVLRGEMSLVGPRPERPCFVSQLSQVISEYPERLKVKPGITGMAQITCGYDSSIESVRHKVKYDLEYAQNGTMLSDLKILLKTVAVVVTGKGAC